MTQTAPRDLLQAVALAIAAAADPAPSPNAPDGNVRSVVDRAPAEWRDDGHAYVTVTQASDLAPDLRGDGDTLTDAALVQASLWERRDREDPDRLAAVLTTVDGVALPGHSFRGAVNGTVRLPDPETDLIQHAITLRYALRRS